MGVTFSTDTDTQAVGDGTITYDIQEFVVSGTPTWTRKNLLRRTWNNVEDKTAVNTNAKSIFYTPGLTNLGEIQAGYDVSTVWTFEDDDPARAKSAFYKIIPSELATTGRTTLVGFSPGTDTFWSDTNVLYGRDRSNLLAYVHHNRSSRAFTGTGLSVSTFYDGANGWLIDASTATLLGDYFFPTPSHLKLLGTTSVYVMSNVAPTNTRAYVQPFLRDTPLEILTQRMGIGGYANEDGQRLIQNLGILDRYWIRPGAPIRPLFRWGQATDNEGEPWTSMNHAAYGLPPVELSGYIGVFTGSPAPTAGLYLTQFKADLSTVSDTLIATVATTFDHTSGATDYYLLQPTDSGHSTTLDADCLAWSVRTGTGASPGSGNFSYWHKVPCFVQPYAMSNIVDGVSAYLPGWLYDPFA